MNILKIFVIWALIIYLPFTIKGYAEKYLYEGGIGVVKFFLLLFRRVFVIGSGPYWYLIALMLSAAFIYICFNRKSDSLLKAGIIIGFILEIAYSCFQGILSNIKVFGLLFKVIYAVWSWEYNFLMFGIPFMGIGYLICKKNISWTAKGSVTVFFISTLIRIFEYNLPVLFPSDFWNNNAISFAFIPQALAYFLLAKNIKLNWSKEKSINVRQLSSCIYFSHAIFLYEFLNPFLDTYTGLPVYADRMIVWKVIITLLCCLVLYVIVKMINNKHLNILING